MRYRDKAPRIIVTRPQPDAGVFAKQACAAGFRPIIAPVMAIIFNANLPAVEGVGAVAFTSANGVRAFAAVGGDACLPAFAVGGVTAQAAKGLGFSDLTAAAGDVESLAGTIKNAAMSGRFAGRVLHVAGADRAGDLVGALRAAGVEAEMATLYQATPAARLSKEAASALAEEPPAEAVALFSPRSARLFIELVRKAGLEDRLSAVTAACLSEAVAKAAGAVAWGGVVVADERTGDSLLSTLLREIERSPG